MGIILISFRIDDDRIDPPLFVSPATPLGVVAAMPFFGTNVDTNDLSRGRVHGK